MQKTVLTKAVAVALATLGAGAAYAQSSLTIYGNADVSVDHVKKTAGVAIIPAIPSSVGKKESVTRVSPSATSQTSFGFKGVEDLGDGYKAGFVLEGQLGHDNGALGQDGRIFGRQAYVGLTTPFGEVRLGRQYAPIFYSTAVVTTERFGATDLFIEGGASNNLHVRWDNQISYWLKAGDLTASVAYSPNAGSYGVVSPLRGSQAGGAGGGVLGAIGAGSESSANKTGRAVGLFANYNFTPDLNATVGFHRNEFDGATFGTFNPLTGSLMTSSFRLDRYHAFNVGAKYTISGITLDAAFGQGKYVFESGGPTDSLKMQFIAVGAKIPVATSASLILQASQAKFKNFTKGKDTGLAIGGDYDLSKRTTLFARLVQIKDDEGSAANAGFAAPVVGGPDVIATAVGFREVPVFAGAGLNPGGKSTYIGAGIRHTF